MMKKYIYIVFSFLIILPGCLKDNINEPVNILLEENAELLHYLEEQGDYINSGLAPSLIEATDVYDNLSNYLIIDIRTPEQFAEGHIAGSKNISNTVLLNYLLTTDLSNYSKIVLVSANGQSSSYYTCLLRIYGFDNVYSMNFGLAYWNIDFALDWIQNIGTLSNIGDFNNINYPKPDFSKLPEINKSSGENISDFAKKRIETLITRGFVDKLDNLSQSSADMYFVCYGSLELYYFPGKDGPGHPAETRLYMENLDLRSVNSLQTIPVDKDILVYDYSGQYSAAVVAYLNILGYKSRTLLFGACQLFYGRMATYLRQYAFDPDRINSFSYERSQ